MTPTSQIKLSDNGLSSTVAWGYESVVLCAGRQYFGDRCGSGLAKPFSRIRFADTSGRPCATGGSSDGLYIVPAFVGLGAPHWDDRARGLLTGLTRGSKMGHLARAVIESIAYQIRDVFDVMQSETDSSLNMLLVDGGGTRNEHLMQFQADILGVTVQRNNTPELSAMGAAYLAGLCVRIWSSTDEITQLSRSVNQFEPRLASSERARLLDGWQEAVARTKLHPEGCIITFFCLRISFRSHDCVTS